MMYNQGMYGNQFQPNPSIYQQPQQQPNYNFQPNAYGQTANYNQNNQNNFNPNPNLNDDTFISGKIGSNVIAKENKEAFMKSLQATDWTQNKNYLEASNMHVGMKTSFQSQLKSEIVEPVCRFERYIGNNYFNYDEYQNYLNSVQEENKRKKEEAEKEKSEFLKVNFPNESPDIPEKDLYDKIEKNQKDILMKDRNLYSKVEKMVLLITSSEPPKQSSGIYAYGRPGMGY